MTVTVLLSLLKFGREDFVSDGEFTCRMFIAEETVDNACNSTFSNKVSPISSDTEPSSPKEGIDKLNSSILSSCISGMNDNAAFIETFDTECFEDDDTTILDNVPVDDMDDV